MMAMMRADATATRVLKESLWLLHLPSSLQSCYDGGEEGDAIDVCGPDSGSLTARGKEHLITSCMARM